MKQEFLNGTKFGLSEGKIQDLKNLVTKMQPDVLVFEEILKPSQNYNLASELILNIISIIAASSAPKLDAFANLG